MQGDTGQERDNSQGASVLGAAAYDKIEFPSVWMESILKGNREDIFFGDE